MSALAADPPLAGRPDPQLTEQVLRHLAAQLGSAERLLEMVLEQGVAIRARDVHAVVRLAGMISCEMARREALERQRSDLLQASGERLGVPPESVTIGRLSMLMDDDGARQASARSAQLRGMLHELQREHLLNRALMKVELSFLHHLMGSLSPDVASYDAVGAQRRRALDGPGTLRVLDMEA